MAGKVTITHSPDPFALHTSPGDLAGKHTLTYRSSIFVHAYDVVDQQELIPGSKVSFIYEPDETSGKAIKVAVEDMWNHRPRKMGKVVVSVIT